MTHFSGATSVFWEGKFSDSHIHGGILPPFKLEGRDFGARKALGAYELVSCTRSMAVIIHLQVDVLP